VTAPNLQLVTRHGCHLCDEMEALLEAALGPAGESWEALDIDRHPELLSRYDESVPVLLRDGAAVAKLRWSERQLRRIVRRRR
jgi:hypothetical protein